ncbi:MAG: NAD(P)H-hydrate dehydratase [Sideroxydans sp.]|nr:NAD(P)H-hydrate dehydratase [Sideroxydans sp.]
MKLPRPTPVTPKQVSAFLKPRQKNSHKGDFGKVAIIGGGDGMIGAAFLAGRAALKLGAGVVHVGLLADKMPLLDVNMPELMVHRAQDTLKLPGLDVIAIGNGLGRSLAAHKLLFDAIKLDVALVLDADALNILAERPDLRGMLFERKRPTLLTPHPGEAARLLHMKTEEVQDARVASALDIAQRYHGNVVLKGADSLIATADGKVFVNKTGNPGMSSAGMGDALCGMVAALLAQGLAADEALLLAVHLHGAAGDALAEQVATIGMSATEVTEWARWLLNQMVAR